MSKSYTTPERFYANLRRRIEQKSIKKALESGTCWEWFGCKKAPDNKYGRISITFMGVSQSVGAHRASYMAFNEIFNLKNDISHICHQPSCVNPDHLSHEEHAVNLERAECREKGVCRGHACYKSCIINGKFVTNPE